MDYDRLVNTLNRLLTRSYDANKGYVEAGNKVSDLTTTQMVILKCGEKKREHLTIRKREQAIWWYPRS